MTGAEPRSQPPTAEQRHEALRKLPQPHRCNDRVEDFIQALFTLEFSAKIGPAWSNFRQCMKSEKG